MSKTIMSYGSPVNLADCVDLGTVPMDAVPLKIDNHTSIFAGREDLRGVYDTDLPPERRVWKAIALYRDKVRSGEIPVPYSVKIPKLGTLVYNYENGLESWEITR